MTLSSIPPDLTYASLHIVLIGFFANMILTFAGVSLFCLNPPTLVGCMCVEQPLNSNNMQHCPALHTHLIFRVQQETLCKSLNYVVFEYILT